jgi:hypothetical protein
MGLWQHHDRDGGSVPLFDDYCTEAQVTLRLSRRVGRSVRPGVHQDLFLCAVPDQDLVEAATRSPGPRSPAPCHASRIATRLQSLPLSHLLVTGG